jgi:hypothetical protein
VNGDAQMFSDILYCVQWPRGLRCQVINVLGSWHVANIQKLSTLNVCPNSLEKIIIAEMFLNADIVHQKVDILLDGA